MSHITELIAICRHEQAMRSTVYPRQIADGKMTQRTADRQNGRLENIIEVLLIVQEHQTVDVRPNCDLTGCITEANREAGWRKQRGDMDGHRKFNEIKNILEQVKKYNPTQSKNPKAIQATLFSILFLLLPFFGFAQTLENPLSRDAYFQKFPEMKSMQGGELATIFHPKFSDGIGRLEIAVQRSGDWYLFHDGKPIRYSIPTAAGERILAVWTSPFCTARMMYDCRTGKATTESTCD